MASIKWCKKYIKITEPNDNLAEEYLSSAEETKEILKNINSNMWKATMKYYAEYFAVYAMLMKIGIKSEIHDCTIQLAKLLEKENILPKNTSKTLEKDKDLRIENQYFLKNTKITLNQEELSEFILKIREKMFTIALEEKEKIRNLLNKS